MSTDDSPWTVVGNVANVFSIVDPSLGILTKGVANGAVIVNFTLNSAATQLQVRYKEVKWHYESAY